jgi:two-component system chemotaxis response regulator CheB
MASKLSSQPQALVAITASAGGIGVVQEVLRDLPRETLACYCIVIHLTPSYASKLDRVLTQASGPRVRFAEEGELLQVGNAYLAPPDHHMMVTPDKRLTLSKSPKRHYTRPSGDHLFETAARCFGKNTILVVLSGMGRNGSESLLEAKTFGATVIAQDPETARFSPMPRAAINSGCVDFVLPPGEIAAKISELIPSTNHEGMVAFHDS